MADKDENGAEFDFSGPDWEDESEASTAGTAAKAASDDPFGAGAFDDDDGIFPGGDGEEGADAFAAAPDPFAADDGDPFSFQDMPTPGAPVAAAPGDPDDEFGDIGDDAFAEADGFKGGGDLFQDDEEEDEQDSRHASPFEDQPADDAGEDDEFAESGEGEAYDDPFGEQGADEKPARGRKAARKADGPAPGRRGSLVKPLALAAAAAFVGYVGYTAVLPMFTQQAPQQVPVPVAEAPSAPAFPTALPGQPGGMELPAQTAQQEPPAIQLPSVQPVPQEPVIAEVPQNTGTQPGVMLPPLADAPSMPSLPASLPEASNPLAVPPAATQPSSGPFAPGAENAYDELTGGRGGIDAMKEASSAQPSATVPEPRLDAIETRISAIEDRLEKLADQVRAGLSAPHAAAPSSGESLPRVSLDTLAPPLKPEIVEGATLKGVSRGLAWVSTASGVVEVRKGDTVPNAGKVVAIRQYGGKWIVATTSGLVVQ